MTESYRIMRLADGRPDVSVFNTEYLMTKAQYATAIIRAMVTSDFGQKETTRTLANVACSLTEEMFAEFRERGWILDLPTADEALEVLDVANRKRQEEATPQTQATEGLVA